MSQADPMERERYHQEWSRKNQDKRKEYSRTTYERHKDRITLRNRRNHLLRSYGVTLERYEEMLAQQNGACAICKKKQKSGRKLAVDHCHTTGQVRGLLCQNCNRQVEAFEFYLGIEHARQTTDFPSGTIPGFGSACEATPLA